MRVARSRLIVALDVPDRQTALTAVSRLAQHVGCFKIGLGLFVAEGPRLALEILDRGARVFLDLKLHDIPNTVAAAVRAASRLGVQMLTVHSSGGPAMLRAAVDAAGESATPPLLLAVTALTSLSGKDLQQVGVTSPVGDWVAKLAHTAIEAGMPGLVASPLEAQGLRRRFGDSVRLVTPGIRPAGTATDDQSRFATPKEAIRAGADWLVVGRPVLAAREPDRAAEAIVSEIEEALRLQKGPFNT